VKRLVSSAEEPGRYKIINEQVVWNFTRDQLIARIANLDAERAECATMLSDIDKGAVEKEIV